MTNTKVFSFSLILLLASCTYNNSNERKENSSHRLLEDPEHHIKDSPDILTHDSSILYTGWYYVSESSNGYKRQLNKQNEIYYINPKPILTAKDLTTFEIYESFFNNKKKLVLSMRLNKDGTEIWSNATLAAQGKKLAFVVDNLLIDVETINSPITHDVTALTGGNYTRAELENFKRIIESEK
jgi:hypothetical protein